MYMEIGIEDKKINTCHSKKVIFVSDLTTSLFTTYSSIAKVIKKEYINPNEKIMFGENKKIQIMPINAWVFSLFLFLKRTRKITVNKVLIVIKLKEVRKQNKNENNSNNIKICVGFLKKFFNSCSINLTWIKLTIKTGSKLKLIIVWK
ncbi:MAG: hypothetical protein ACRAS9_02425 [Mycoplasma sp.]